MSNILASLQENWLIVLGSAIFGAVILGVVIEAMKSKAAQKAEAGTKAMAAHVRTLGGDLRSHVGSLGSALRTDIAKAVHHSAAPAASIAADTPPSTVAPAEPAAAPSAGDGGIVPSVKSVNTQEKSMSPLENMRATAAVRQEAAKHPMAINLLHNFKQVAALVDLFLSCPNEFAKYALWKKNFMLYALQSRLGISGGWVNAIDYDGLIDGRNVNYATFDVASNQITFNIPGVAPSGAITASNPANSWATVDGNEPSYYVPLAKVSGSGAQILADYLTSGATPGTYLYGLGLTPEAIAAARA